MVVLWRMLPWDRITPFGKPVEPDVYCSSTGVSDVRRGRGADSNDSGTISSVARTRNRERGPFVLRKTLRVEKAISSVVSATVGSASATIDSNRINGRFGRGR